MSSCIQQNQLSSSIQSRNKAFRTPRAGNYRAALLSALKECGRSANVSRGKQLHSRAIETGVFSEINVANTLISMYGKCRCMLDAQLVFDGMANRDVVSWNCVLQGYVNNGDCHLVLHLFESFLDRSTELDARTYAAALTACAVLASKGPRYEVNKWLEKAMVIYTSARSTLCCDIFLENILVNMFCRCRRMTQAQNIFDNMERRDVVTWNSLIQGYVDNGESEGALKMFARMEDEACSPDNRTFLAALTACSTLASGESETGRWLEQGRLLHSRAVKGSCCNTFVGNMLINMYAKCGSMGEAREVFDRMTLRDVVSWNALLRGYVENGECDLGLSLFDAMHGVVPDERTYLAALTACTELAVKHPSTHTRRKVLHKGREIHSRALEAGLCDMFVQTGLVDMYAKCGCMESAQAVFDTMARKDVLSWNCLVQGYVDSGNNELALQLVEKMDSVRLSRNSATYVAALAACGNLLALERGVKFHEEARAQGVEKHLAACLVQFYGRCGSMESAEEAFISAAVKDIWAWNGLIYGYSQQGDAARVFELLERMKASRVPPNEVTFTHVLTACSHAGLTEKGKECFEEMRDTYGISPDIIHYTCMVDLLARGNFMDEALKVVRGMPCEPDVVTWTAVLCGCQKWNNVVVGRVAYEALLRLNDRDSAAYVFMANIFKGLGKNSKDLPTGCRLSAQTRWTDRQGVVHTF